MIHRLLITLLLVIGLLGFSGTTEAAGCHSAMNPYESGQYVIVNATFWCTGVTRTGKVCAGGTCSQSVTIPSTGKAASTSVAWKMPTFCVSTSNVAIRTYISGVPDRSYNFYYC